MQITTKFNIGDKVLILWNDKAREVSIESIAVYINKDETDIEYGITSFSSTANESRIFATKQELLDSI